MQLPPFADFLSLEIDGLKCTVHVCDEKIVQNIVMKCFTGQDCAVQFVLIYHSTYFPDILFSLPHYYQNCPLLGGAVGRVIIRSSEVGEFEPCPLYFIFPVNVAAYMQLKSIQRLTSEPDS